MGGVDIHEDPGDGALMRRSAATMCQATGSHASGAYPLLVMFFVGCEVRKDDLQPACDVNLHGDDSTCGNGKVDAGELCLVPGGSLPLPEAMHRYRNLTLADFNGDGHLDVRIGATIRAGNGDGTFADAIVWPDGSTDARDCVSGDFNGDGIADLAFSDYEVKTSEDSSKPPNRKAVWVWFGNEKLDPHSRVDVKPSELYDYPVRLAAGDLNSDGLDDLVVPLRSSDQVPCSPLVLLSAGGGSFVANGLAFAVGLGSAADCDRVVVAELSGDEHADIENVAPYILIGDGKGKFEPTRSEPHPFGQTAIYNHRIDCDGFPDAVDLSGGAVHVWKGVGKALFERVKAGVGNDEKFMTIAEVNGDHESDLIVAGSGGLRVFFGDVGFSFSAPSIVAKNPDILEIEVGDLNEDGQPDILTLESVQVRVYLSDP